MRGKGAKGCMGVPDDMSIFTQVMAASLRISLSFTAIYGNTLSCRSFNNNVAGGVSEPRVRSDRRTFSDMARWVSSPAVPPLTPPPLPPDTLDSTGEAILPKKLRPTRPGLLAPWGWFIPSPALVPPGAPPGQVEPTKDKE